MVHLLKNVDLPLEPLHSLWVVNGLLLNEFGGPLKPGDLVDTPADFSIGAFSKLLLDFVIICKLATLFFDKTKLRHLVHMRPAVSGDI